MAAEEQTVLPAKIIDSPADWPVGSTFWPGIDISPICPSPLCGRRVRRHFLAVLEHHGQKKTTCQWKPMAAVDHREEMQYIGCKLKLKRCHPSIWKMQQLNLCHFLSQITHQTLSQELPHGAHFVFSS